MGDSSQEITPNTAPQIRRWPSAEHLKQYRFQPGNCANPGGRPKKVTSTLEKRATRKALKKAADALLATAGTAGKNCAPAFVVLRETLEGKLPSTDNLHLSGNITLTLAERIARARELQVEAEDVATT